MNPTLRSRAKEISGSTPDHYGLRWKSLALEAIDTLEALESCPGNDPTCPGHDHGDPCHYRGQDAMRVETDDET